MTTLRFLHFDLSIDTDERITLDAMASVRAVHYPQLQTELTQVLTWLTHQHDAHPGSSEDGGTWDIDLRGTVEHTQDLTLHFDPQTGQLTSQPEPGERVRHGISVSLSLAPWLAEMFMSAFGICQSA